MGILVMLIGLFTTTITAAQGPFYRIAKNAAKFAAQNAWNTINKDCTKATTFVQIVGDAVDNAAKDIGTKFRGRSAEDFGHGYIDGLMEILDKAVQKCTGKCQMLGTANGKWSAKMFCSVAKAIRKTPTFTVRLVNINDTVCGIPYKMGCESEFVSTATAECPAYTRGKNQAKFTKFYRAADGGSCSYNPTASPSPAVSPKAAPASPASPPPAAAPSPAAGG